MFLPLRTRFDALHDRFGTAGILIAVIALVAALGGTAVAANNALTGKEKKQVRNIAKKFAGKRGAKGTPGPAGPLGPQGPAGIAGPAGANGDAGPQGDEGAPGASVFVEEEPAGDNCEVGGQKLSSPVSGISYVCDGKIGEDGEPGEDGESGPEGSPWTMGGTVPSGETLKGSWSIGQVNADAADEPVYLDISFGIPLAASPTNVHFFPNGSDPLFTTHCPGTVSDPQASPGRLCIYAAAGQTNWTVPVAGGLAGNTVNAANKVSPDPTVGAVIEGGTDGAGPASAFGTWAVTAPN